MSRSDPLRTLHLLTVSRKGRCQNMRRTNCVFRVFWFTCLGLALLMSDGTFAADKQFRAGAAAVDITPTNFPVIVNGGFFEKTATNITDRLHARALALDDGTTRLVLCVVDTCMMPRDLIDRAKELARRQTGLRTDRMLVSATHTHSAPSAMACLGSRADTNYVAFLPGKIAEAIAEALRSLQPARIGWASVDDWDHTFNRRWIRRPDKLIVDPYGQPTGRAHMHPGHQSPDAIGPSGPVDPELSVLAVQTKDGRPLALLGNYSQHYFGAPALSADYYGRFAEHISSLVAADASRLTSNAKPETQTPAQDPGLLTPAATGVKFIAMMSQGTSGDLMWMDYAAPRRQINHDTYAREVADRAFAAYRQITWHDWVPLRMTEAKLPLAYRVPDADRLAWARKVAASYSDRLPRNWAEVYANEALILHERQRTELVLQALRIGDLAIAALPNEVYALTGLKLKAQSPLKTFNIELANGAEGYIPPPEQHALGGYTTWPARTAGLETNAEPKIVEALLKLLEQVSGKPRRQPATAHGPYAQAVLGAQPAAYWRFEEMVFPTAKDATRNRNDATYGYGIALHLPGVGSGTGISPNPALTPSAFSGPHHINRAAHFAGGRLKADLRLTGKACSVEFWLWNGLPVNLRATTGTLLAWRNGERLGITGTNGPPGRLFYSTGADPTPRLVGKTGLGLKQWHQVVLVREGGRVSAFLDGSTAPEFSGDLPETAVLDGLLLGGGGVPEENFEGRLDEVAVYDRALRPEEIAAHWKLSGLASRRTAGTAEREPAAQR